MATRKTPQKRTKSTANTHGHRHEKGRCLHILQQLSAYIDDELSTDICQEIRRHLGACPDCETFVASLRQTVSLCRHSPSPTLSKADRARMRQSILASAKSK